MTRLGYPDADGSDVANTLIDTREPAAGSSRRWYDRPIIAPLVLTAVLFALAQLAAPGGYLSTDVGGKVATLEVMTESGPLEPDLGYWAEEHDPDGSLYPMFSTTRFEGRWVNVTTVPMLLAALPLYAAGGERLAIAIPVLGAVLAAAAARALARRLDGDEGQQRMAFWLVGLASPVTIYALDLWEHSLGLGLMIWGVVAAIDASLPVARRSVPFLAGLAFGAAASMRQEALVYGFAAGVAVVVRLALSRRVAAIVRRGATMVVGTAVALLANAVLEVVVFGGMLRSARGTGTARSAGGDALDRLKEALLTGASPFPGDRLSTYAVAGFLAVLLVTLGFRATRPAEDRRTVEFALAAIAALIVFDLVVGGLGFVPGLLATTPLAGVGLARGWAPGSRRFVTFVATIALPIVWLTQFTGGAGPQWGGRYILTSGVLLLVVAVVSLHREQAGSTLRILAGAGAVVALIGVAWTVQRTHAFDDAAQALADRPEPALVFDDPFLSREAGPLVLEERWLAAHGVEARAEAVAVLEAAGIIEAGFVDYADGSVPRELPGWRLVGESRVPLVNGLELRVTTWKAP